MSTDERPALHVALEVESSEARLVEEARARSELAWTLIYEKYFEAIYRYVFYRLHSREAAEDVASEVFAEALRGIERYRYTGRPFRAWLYRIAHNLTVDQIRRATRDANRRQEVVDFAGADRTDDLVESTDVLLALARLPAEQQQVVILRFLEGLASGEVAAAMGKSESAVKALQHRALEALRKDLGARAPRALFEREAA